MTIGKRIAGAFGLTVLVLVVVGVLAFLSMTRLVEHNRWVSHTYQVLTELGTLHLFVKDGEAGTRAYMITGIPTDANPARAALANYGKHYNELTRLTADNPQQQTHLKRLGALLQEKFRIVQEFIRLKDKDDNKAATELLKDKHTRQ